MGTRTFKMDVTTEAQQVCDEAEHHRGILIYNNGSLTVYVISHKNMSTSEGIPVAAGASFDDDDCRDPLYIIGSSGTVDIRVFVTEMSK